MATRGIRGITLGLAVLLATPAWALAQAADPPPAATTPQQASTGQTSAGATQGTSATPNFDRIRDAINRPPALKLDDGKVRFYVEVTAKWPTFAEMARGYDLRHGPTARGNPMTHQEFLNLVTPREMYGSAGIRAGELLQMALVNAIGQLIVKRGLEAMAKARDAREIQNIREQIERELTALRGGK